VFYQFVAPPLTFNPVQSEKVRTSAHAAEYQALEATHASTFAAKREAAMQLVTAMESGDASSIAQ
jgi:SSS family solute:Na+ symporter